MIVADAADVLLHTVVRRAPQVMVKVTGGGRGMGAIGAHLRYISKNSPLLFEDDQGVGREGKEALRDVTDQWRLGGERIPETSARREAFNIMLSMPAGTDPEIVRHAAREFAKVELPNHRYVMVLHTHLANPHVHMSARAAGREGKRLNPRKEDLHRWRETFAEKLRDWGIEAKASSQATRGVSRRSLRAWERRPGAVAHPGRRTDVARAVQRRRDERGQAELPGMALEAGQGRPRVQTEPNRGPDLSLQQDRCTDHRLRRHRPPGLAADVGQATARLARDGVSNGHSREQR